MVEFKYVLNFFLNRNNEIIKVDKIDNFSKFIAECFGTNYSNFGFVLKKKDKSENKFFKYSPKNLEKLHSMNPQKLVSVYFEKFKLKVDFQDTDLSLKIITLSNDEYPVKIKIIIDPILTNRSFEFSNLLSIMGKIDQLGFEMESGVVSMMETKKMPMFFLSGIQTPDLNQEEREVANALAINIRNYRRQIWDIFWINIIKKNLINSNLLDEITILY